MYFVAWLIFFCSITTPNLLLLCFCQKLQVPIFIAWSSFVMLLGRVCFWLSCVHALWGSWPMFCVIVARLSIFLGMRVKTWCVRKFPGHPGPQIMHAYAPPCPSYLVLSLIYTFVPISIHTQPYISTCTLFMLIKYILITMYNSLWFWKNIGVNMYM